MNVLIVAAHPDDEVLGAGGTIARLAERGNEVEIIFFGRGRNEEQCAAADTAADILGVHPPMFHLFGHDQLLDMVPLRNIIEPLTEFDPDWVITHCERDGNQDHRRVAHAARIAFRPQPGRRIERIMAMEILSTTEFARPPFCPSMYVDVSHQIEKKLDALACYESEIRSDPHPRSFANIKRLGELRGSQSNCRFAEAFEVVYWRL